MATVSNRKWSGAWWRGTWRLWYAAPRRTRDWRRRTLRWVLWACCCHGDGLQGIQIDGKKGRKIWILFWFKAVWLCLCSGLNNKHNINVSVVFTVNHVSLDLDALQSSVCRTTRRSVYLRYNKLCRFYWYERQSSVSSLQRFIKRFLITTTCHLSSSSSRLLPKIYSSDQYQQFTVDNPWGEFLFSKSSEL